MGRFRRRRSQVLWLPILGNDVTNQVGNVAVITGETGVAQNANTRLTSIHRLTFDQPADNTAIADRVLSDYTQSGYLLKRLVGKLHAVVNQNANQEAVSFPKYCLYAAGFMVLRTDQTGVPLSATTPDKYSVVGSGNEEDPWIWRRTWYLGNGQANQPGGAGVTREQAFYWGTKTATWDFGSVADGPHIDSKIKRRVGPEESLFFVSSTYSDSSASTDPGRVYWTLDLRILATPIKMSNRRNASR